MMATIATARSAPALPHLDSRLTGLVLCPPSFFPDGEDPDAYALILSGRCMEPELFHGDMAIVSPAAPLQAGDIVCCWFRDKPVWLKRLVQTPMVPVGMPSTVSSLVLLEMLNPPQLLPVRGSTIRAMHKVVGWHRAMDLAAVRMPLERSPGVEKGGGA